MKLNTLLAALTLFACEFVEDTDAELTQDDPSAESALSDGAAPLTDDPALDLLEDEHEEWEPVAEGLAHPAAPTAAGSSTQSNHGLTCKNSWKKTWGGTKCSGSAGVKWQLHVRCKWQGDYKGPWNFGPGSDGFECTFGVQNSSVIWA